MRYVRIFLLYFENVFQYRGRIFIWFLIFLLHPIIYLLFWKTSPASYSDILSYYLLFIIAGGLLYVHVDMDAYEDIQQGQMSLYLVKPLSYISAKFMSELPWRLMQGGFGIAALGILSLFIELPRFLLQYDQLIIAIVITVLGYCIMFLFKMIILLSALWVTDIGGLQQFSELIVISLSGFIMPIRYFPEWLASIIYLSPFPYTLYFPVTAFQGLIASEGILRLFSTQIAWIILLYTLYRFMWAIGLKQYSLVSQ